MAIKKIYSVWFKSARNFDPELFHHHSDEMTMQEAKEEKNRLITVHGHVAVIVPVLPIYADWRNPENRAWARARIAEQLAK